ncbi:MAG: hypothetical protein IT228_13170 [Flavobacteriales bacterium]|nr:hypothetical protein [Flavobacteriales bacterium]MCC6578285.1 hypothetical protein [Flavobacteriales bacterium]NUQ15163.1 hypothetical protein [Flavobacteriales bacterium]
MKSTARRLVLSAAALLCARGLSAQEEARPEPVTGTFAGTQVVNAQSVEVVPRKRSFGFMIQHRFGTVGTDEQVWKQFAGLDLPANIRFSFQYAPFQNAQLELGRSKNGKVWDLGAKLRVLRQTVEDEMPVSLTVLANAALMSDDHPATGDRDFFADGTTPFAYRFEHRLSYSAQLILARRFTPWLSLQVAPVAVHRNLVAVGEHNFTLATVLSGRFKVSTKGSVLVEAAPIVMGHRPGHRLEPLALAYEVATQGHVFQIVLSSGQEIIEQRAYTMPTSRYDEGQFHLGFNIARTLLVKPKAPKH